MAQIVEAGAVTLVNPYGIDPATEFLAQPDPKVALWSETMFFSFWDPSAEVGLYVHTGRFPDQVDLWWAKTCAYLPGGVVVIDRSFGRPTDHRGPATGNFALTCEEPMRAWSAHFDGAGEHTTSEATLTGLCGSGPAVPMRFTLSMDAVSPVWDLHKALSMPERSWASVHHEQTHRARGNLTVGERTWDLDGVTFRDHSVGARDLGPMGGDNLLGVVFGDSGRSLQAVMMWNREDELELCTGWVHDPASGFTALDDLRIPRQSSLGYEPRAVDMNFDLDGAAHHVRLEILHGFAMTMADPNSNMNGAGLHLDDPLVMTECPVRATWTATGEVGYGHFERNQRLSRLSRT